MSTTRTTCTHQSDDDFDEAQRELLEVGNRIRELKEMGQPHQQTEEVRQRIAALVSELNQVKERHCQVILARIDRCVDDDDDDDDDESSTTITSLVQLLPTAVAKDMKKKLKQKAKKRQAIREKKFNRHEGVQDVRCQRKIENLMAHEGEGDNFRYFSRINEKVDFCKGDLVYLTEKMDGTTMQATNNGVYKRFERQRARKAKNWHKLSEDQRYSLERVDLESRQNCYIIEAVSPYLDLFSRLPKGTCVYFEALGPHIGSRFKNVELPETIRVFDSAQNGEFSGFASTVELCQRIGLPIVAHSAPVELNLTNILTELASKPQYTDYASPLEGYVVRSIGRESSAAKIRVDDLLSLAVEE